MNNLMKAYTAMVYEVYYCKESCKVSLGLYASLELAQHALERLQSLQAQPCFLREVHINNQVPQFFTHGAYIAFEDINKVHSYTLEHVVVSTSNNEEHICLEGQPPLTHLKELTLSPPQGVCAYGSTASEAIIAAKTRVISLIHDGTYGYWKQSKEKKEIAYQNAVINAQACGIELNEQGEPLEEKDKHLWNTLVEQALKQAGFTQLEQKKVLEVSQKLTQIC